MQEPIDAKVENHGSIFLIQPETDTAKEWIEEYIGPDNGFQPYYPTIVVEHRYIQAIIDGMMGAGLNLA